MAVRKTACALTYTVSASNDNQCFLKEYINTVSMIVGFTYLGNHALQPAKCSKI
jgi:hypothetical protein